LIAQLGNEGDLSCAAKGRCKCTPDPYLTHNINPATDPGQNFADKAQPNSTAFNISAGTRSETALKNAGNFILWNPHPGIPNDEKVG
jgi:hypothetical protein